MNKSETFKFLKEVMRINLIFSMIFFCNFQFIYSTMQGPDFIIIGAQKGGTTSLFYYLCQHPQIRCPKVKEVSFFTLWFQKGIDWYIEQFPKKNDYKFFLTGEATPNYISEPYVAERVLKYFPNIKFIITLRNPVDRAYSHYQMCCRNGGEDKPFEKWLNIAVQSRGPFCHNVLEYGKYVNQLRPWFDLFDRSQFLIIDFQDLSENPIKVINKVFKFLEIEPKYELNITPRNVGNYSSMSSYARQCLNNYYKPYNLELESLLGVKFNWN